MITIRNIHHRRCRSTHNKSFGSCNFSDTGTSKNGCFDIETCIIGAGVIGLATARALAKAGQEVLLLERNSAIGAETSSRNSEVIHAGIYYPPLSLKAKLCVQGKELLYDYCRSHSIPHEIKGKLIVATNPYQAQYELPKIQNNAIQNGVSDLRFISDPTLVTQYYESEIVCHGALFSPSTGIIDSHSFMLSLLADAELGSDTGTGKTTLALHSNVDGLSITKNGKLKVEVEGMELICQHVVNCAGLKAADIAQMIKESASISSSQQSQDINHSGNRNDSTQHMQHYRQYFAKGNYYRLQQKAPFQHLVYPVPEKGGLGVHATIDLAGNTRFGPDVEWIHPDVQNPDDIDLSVDPNRSNCFYEEVRKYWPGLEDDSLVPDYCGIRPKLAHPIINSTMNHDNNNNNNTTDFQKKIKEQPPSLYADFRIESEANHGIKGFVNLQGIESPGLTSSLAVAEFVKQIIFHK